MPVYDVSFSIHDSDHEYTIHAYEFSKNEDEALQKAIEYYSFMDKTQFKELDPDITPGKAWEEIPPGYRIYELENVTELRLHVDGLSVPLNITELMSRPPMPLHSSDAEWHWQRNNLNIYWWYMGNYYIQSEESDVDTDDLFICSFYDLQKSIEDLTEKGWLIKRKPK